MNKTCIPSGSLVLVTGINGHIGSTLAVRLLDQGFRVRGTVRSIDKGEFMKDVLSSSSPYGDRSALAARFELVQIPDFETAGAYNEAMEDVSGVLHVASPNTMDQNSPEIQEGPAVKGTLAILTAASVHPNVTRVTVIGTIGSMIMNGKHAGELTEETDWNCISEDAAKDPNNSGVGFHCYLNSKIKAEKAAWEYIRTQKPSFTFNVVLPSIALGPIFHQLPSPPRADVSLGNLWDYLGNRRPFAASSVNILWVHSYDVADCMIRSLISPDAVGKRFICTGGKTSWAEVCKIIQRHFPECPVPEIKENEHVPQFPGAEEIEFDLSATERILDVRWRSLEEAVVDASRDLLYRSKINWGKAY
ncbi:methylglyoxal reductase (NADPH-dependent) gre2 [Stygiomarasmius scandens]|uniref:Methylglyoxal reductase (NADPH-dependent) gre2 n=1 Tax=Marasmiellus scandens TaxID=2682957 RepID=A0ABR1JF02_9AGAR